MARRERNMEQRLWLWRRRSSDQATLGDDPFGLLPKGNLDVAEELKRSLKTLDHKLTSAIDESNAKDELLEKHARVAEEALEGWEKAESEAAFFKQELENAEKKISVERERAQNLEQKLANVVLENSSLVETLTEKERETETKLLSLEDQNASLKYDLCMIEEELQIRNEEKEKKQSAMAKRVSELEAECQRLKAMLRRRFPSSAAAGKAAQPPPSKFASLEDEIRVLSQALGKKTMELQSSWIMCARTASKLSRAETELEELRRSAGGAAAEHSGDLSSATSWASALISELENFRPKTPAGATPEKSISLDSLSSSDAISLSSATKRLAELADEIKDKISDAGDGSLQLQWKSSEAKPILEGFLHSYSIYMDQKGDLESFLQALVTVLQWAAGNCSTSPKTKEREQDPPLKSTGWEISMASEKLAECQETILNLGKQLKMLNEREEVMGERNPNRRVALGEWIMADKEKNPRVGLLYGVGVERCAVEEEREEDWGKGGSEMGAIVVAQKRSRRGVSLLLRRLLLKRKEKGARKLALHAVSL